MVRIEKKQIKNKGASEAVRKTNAIRRDLPSKYRKKGFVYNPTYAKITIALFWMAPQKNFLFLYDDIKNIISQSLWENKVKEILFNKGIIQPLDIGDRRKYYFFFNKKVFRVYLYFEFKAYLAPIINKLDHEFYNKFSWMHKYLGKKSFYDGVMKKIQYINDDKESIYLSDQLVNINEELRREFEIRYKIKILKTKKIKILKTKKIKLSNQYDIVIRKKNREILNIIPLSTIPPSKLKDFEYKLGRFEVIDHGLYLFWEAFALALNELANKNVKLYSYEDIFEKITNIIANDFEYYNKDQSQIRFGLTMNKDNELYAPLTSLACYVYHTIRGKLND